MQMASIQWLSVCCCSLLPSFLHSLALGGHDRQFSHANQELQVRGTAGIGKQLQVDSGLEHLLGLVG